MDYEDPALILRYEIHDPCRDYPWRQLLIMKHAPGIFWRTEDTALDPEGPERFLAPDDTVYREICSILSEERLYQLEPLERPRENWGGTYDYDFYFSSGERKVSYRGYELEYILGKSDCPKVNYLYSVLERIGRRLIPQGVPAKCFEPAARIFSEPLRPVPRAAASFAVYDMNKADFPVMLGGDQSSRLEYYGFDRLTDGTFALRFQVGWIGGTGHWDGAGNSFVLPVEWFGESFETFLEKLTERYPAEKYGYTYSELAETGGLREFLGWK